MKTPAELIDDARRALGAMEDDAGTIFDYATLIGVLTAGPDADTALEGIRRLMIEIRNRADNSRRHHDDATQAVQRLANP
jgi:hypothetical protein